MTQARGDIDVVVKHACDPVDDRQSKTETFLILSVRVVQAVKLLEDRIDLRGIDTDAGIPDTDAKVLTPDTTPE